MKSSHSIFLLMESWKRVNYIPISYSSNWHLGWLMILYFSDRNCKPGNILTPFLIIFVFLKKGLVSCALMKTSTTCIFTPAYSRGNGMHNCRMPQPCCPIKVHQRKQRERPLKRILIIFFMRICQFVKIKPLCRELNAFKSRSPVEAKKTSLSKGSLPGCLSAHLST